MKKFLLMLTLLNPHYENGARASSFCPPEVYLQQGNENSILYNPLVYTDDIFPGSCSCSPANDLFVNPSIAHQGQDGYFDPEETQQRIKKFKPDPYSYGLTAYWFNQSTINSRPIVEFPHQVITRDDDVAKQHLWPYTFEQQGISLSPETQEFTYNLLMKCKKIDYETGQDMSCLISLLEADLYPHHSSNSNSALNSMSKMPLVTTLSPFVNDDDCLMTDVGSGNFLSSQHQIDFHQNSSHSIGIETTTKSKAVVSLNIKTQNRKTSRSPQPSAKRQFIETDHRMSMTLPFQNVFITFDQYHLETNMVKHGGKRGREILVMWDGSPQYICATKINNGLAVRWQVLRYIEMYQFLSDKDQILPLRTMRQHVRDLPRYIDLCASTFNGYYCFMYHYGSKKETDYFQQYKYF